MSEIEETILSTMHKRPCCTFGAVSTQDLPDWEKSFFTEFMRFARTALVVGHHVTTEEEWTWYGTDDGGERCDADDHTKEVCLVLKHQLMQYGFQTDVVKYPGESGLQFRYVAQATGLGRIGKNAFLLHREWGPWIHLRVLATAASLNVYANSAGDQPCHDCGLCVSACPAGAIRDEYFEGLACWAFRKAKGEYVPVGPKREYRYCKACADVCPTGEKPLSRKPENEGVEQSTAPDVGSALFHPRR